MKTPHVKVGKGSMKLPLLGHQYFTVFGGPYRECPRNLKGVKMAAEINQEAFVDIPTKDYQVPHKNVLYAGLSKAVKQIVMGETLYVGCMGGMGRTGLFLAVLAKAFGVKKPVEYVREHYYAHAVETPEQYDFVQAFVIHPEVRTMVKKARLHYMFRFWRRNLTNIPWEALAVEAATRGSREFHPKPPAPYGR